MRTQVSSRRIVLVAAVLCSAAVLSSAETLNYTYDFMQRLTRVAYTDGTVIDYAYDNLGNRLTRSITLSGAPANHAPGAVSNPSVTNNATGVPVLPTLSWTGGGDPDAGDAVVYFVYFGASASPPLAFSGSATSWSPGRLQCFTTYYWQVVARDNHNAQSVGPLWTFTTGPDVPIADFVALPASGQAQLAVTFQDRSVGNCGALTSWQWDFNNDGVVDSTVQNPTTTYLTAGDYTVKLTVQNAAGQSATMIKTNYIHVLGSGVVDLRPLELKVESAFYDKHLLVSYSVTNRGTVSVEGEWQWTDGINVATTTDWSGRLGGLWYERQSLPAGTLYRRTNAVSLNNETTAEGYYLALKADARGEIGENNEMDNVIAVPLHGSLPDLVPVRLSYTGQAQAGQSIPLAFAVTNQGSLPIEAEWADQVYLSTNAVLDGSDSSLGVFTLRQTLAPGASCAATNNVALPSGWRPGNYYLLLKTDTYTQVVESNKVNNLLAVPFTMVGPDLAAISFQAPSAVLGPPYPKVTLSWGVTNQGNGATLQWWKDAVYVSTNAFLDSAAVLVNGGFEHRESLAAGAAYWQTNLVTLPVTQSGNYYVIFKTDRYNEVLESNTNNNVLVVPVAFNIQPPDLAPVAFQAPPALAAEANPSVTLAWGVTNRGPGSAEEHWWDAVYFSTNAVLDSTATWLAEYYQAGPVPVGGCYWQTNTAWLTVTQSGSYYLIFKANYRTNVLPESDTNNNTLASPFTFVLTPPGTWGVNPSAGPHGTISPNTPQVVANGASLGFHATPDAGYVVDAWRVNGALVPTNGPDFLLVNISNRTSVEVTFKQLPDLVPTRLSLVGASGRAVTLAHTVTNLAPVAAGGVWYDYFYVSSNAVWDAADYYLGSYRQSTGVASNGSYTGSSSLTLPSWANESHYLIVNANGSQQLIESTLTNNILAVPLAGQILPDLAPVAVGVTSVSGRTLTLAHTVTNQGPVGASGVWYDYFYVSSNAVWDAGDYSMGWYRMTTSVPSEGGYTATNSFALPSWANTSHYLLVKANETLALPELTQTNNTLVTPMAAQRLPDLVPVGLSALSVSGGTIKLAHTVTNHGPVTGGGVWYDYFYASSNAVWDASDYYLGSYRFTAGVAGGGSYNATNTFSLPSWADDAQGYYAIVRTDSQNALFEGNDENNWRTLGMGRFADADNDGLPDWWEEQYFGSATNCVAGADPDGDRMSNLLEYMADTNPTNALSVLRVYGIIVGTNSVRVGWQGGAQARQYVERAQELTSTGALWIVLQTNNPPTPTQTNLVDPLSTNRSMFYRIRATRD